MEVRTELRAFGWILAGSILLVPIVTGAIPLSGIFLSYERNRWVHFLAYMAVAAVLLIKRRLKAALLVIVITAILGPLTEYLRAFVWHLAVWSDGIACDLFGLTAGALLGMNIRVMKMSRNAATRDGMRQSGAASL